MWDLDFSLDGGQTYLYTGSSCATTGRSSRISRAAAATRASFTGSTTWPSTPGANIYTTEVDNAKRVQKFAFQGLFPPATEKLGARSAPERLEDFL